MQKIQSFDWLHFKFKFQIFKFKTNFCVCRFLLQNVFLKLINIFVFFVFILVDAFSGSIETEKIQKIFLPWQKIISAKENFRALAWTLAKLYLRERVAKRIFKTHKHFCFLCFHSCWRFFWFHKDRENTKDLFSLAEDNFGERKLLCTRLNFGKILFAGTKRAVPGGQYRSILPARVANQNTEFTAYCPLAELAI